MFELDFTIKNAWILSLIFLVVSYLPILFGGKGAKRLVDFSWMNKQGKRLSILIMILFIFMVVSPVFMEITNNPVLLILGFGFFTIGCIFILISYLNYFTTPLGQLITKGMYRISRNPIYVFSSIALIGIAILSESLLFGLLLLLYFIIQHPVIKEEERFCEENFGKEYDKYKKRTRRYL
ncbi:MAG: isoprenylcysteine carboxylmethyltransferase family protein [Salinivirgaceae bacterium]|nr:isoprenylcysteine carboxylmethyltransferase family protein [Salinivirgaceae bacterium]